MTRDLPTDILHHLLLGWEKKAFDKLKNDHLSERGVSKFCAIIDNHVWVEYKTRTNSNALRSIGSQIGRNIKGLAQVLWFDLYILIQFEEEEEEDMMDLYIILRTIFYLSKMNCILFNEHQVVWTHEFLRVFTNLLQTVQAHFAREMDAILRGSKSHDLLHHLLEDVERHGPPSGFDCSPGESKMRVQKLKNYYSNKAAPSQDVAKKIMKTEVTRHIFDGGILNFNGTDVPGNLVVEEGVS